MCGSWGQGSAVRLPGGPGKFRKAPESSRRLSRPGQQGPGHSLAAMRGPRGRVATRRLLRRSWAWGCGFWVSLPFHDAGEGGGASKVLPALPSDLPPRNPRAEAFTFGLRAEIMRLLFSGGAGSRAQSSRVPVRLGRHARACAPPRFLASEGLKSHVRCLYLAAVRVLPSPSRPPQPGFPWGPGRGTLGLLRDGQTRSGRAPGGARGDRAGMGWARGQLGLQTRLTPSRARPSRAEGRPCHCLCLTNGPVLGVVPGC